jgi:hypothetical protein
MKKFLILSLVLGLLGTEAFAEIVWSGTGRLVLVPFAYRGENSDKDVPAATYFGSENPWGGDGPRIGLGVTGKREQENMGFQIALDLESGAPVVDDNTAAVWIKPFKTLTDGALGTLKGTFGLFNDNTLRFKYAGSGMGFHNYVMYVRGDLTDEGTTFQGFTGRRYGTLISIEPADGLWIGAGTGSVGNSRSFAGELKEDGFIDALKSAQFGFGYTIGDLGTFRAQYVGFLPKDKLALTQEATGTNPAVYGYINNTLDVTLNNIGDAGKLQVAFNLKALKGLDIDIGFNYRLPEEKDYYNDLAGTTKTYSTTVQPEHVFSVAMDSGGSTWKPFRLWAVFSTKFGAYTETVPVTGASTKTENGTAVTVMLNPWYYLSDTLILSADLFFDSRTGSDLGPIIPDGDPTPNPQADAKNNYFDTGFGLYLRKNFAGGDIRVGATVKLPGGDAHEGAAPQFFFPIMLNYGF